MAVFIEDIKAPSISYTRGKGTAKRECLINWGDIDALFIEYFPSVYVDASGIVIPPVATFPGRPLLILQGISIDPFDDNVFDGGFGFPAAATKAKVELTYSTEDYDQKGTDPHTDTPAGNQGGQTFLSYKVDFAGQYLHYPVQALTWDVSSKCTPPTTTSTTTTAAGTTTTTTTTVNPCPGALGVEAGKAVSDDVGATVVVATIQHTLTWHWVPFPPWNAIRACLGQVNAFTFENAPPETLLFVGLNGSREMTSQGVRAWQLDYKFAEKNTNWTDPRHPEGWNHFFRPQTGVFSRLMRRSSGGTGTLNAAIGATDSNLTVTASRPFSSTGRFYIKIDNEIMAATVSFSAGSTQGTTTIMDVVRGQEGQPAAAHSANATVSEVPVGVYTKADMSKLFLPGLITG